MTTEPNLNNIQNKIMLQKINAEALKLKLEAQQEIDEIKSQSSPSSPSSSPSLMPEIQEIKNQTMLQKIKAESHKSKLEAQQEIEKIKNPSLNKSSEIKEKIDNLKSTLEILKEKINIIPQKSSLQGETTTPPQIEDPLHNEIPESISSSPLYNDNVPFYMYRDVYKLLKNNNLKIKDEKEDVKKLNLNYSDENSGKKIDENYEKVMNTINEIIEKL